MSKKSPQILPIILTLLLISLIAWYAIPQRETPLQVEQSKSAQRSDSSSTLPTSVAAGQPAQASENINDWISQWRVAPTDELLEKGLEIAEARHTEMKTLISQSPGQAIDKMLSFKDYLDLPAEIAKRIEKPFAITADFSAIPFCSHPETHGQHTHNDEIEYIIEFEDRLIKTYLPKERDGLISKKRIPLTGIELDNIAALHKKSALDLTPSEISAASELFSLVSASEVPPEMLIGDQLLPSNGEISNTEINETLLNAEKQPGPNSVNAVMEVLAASGSTSVQSSLSTALETAASNWTERGKSVVLLRVNFSDKTDPKHSYENSVSLLEVASNRLEEMSYGKTSLSVIKVSDNSITLPKTASEYKTLGQYAIYNDAIHLAADEEGIDVLDYDHVGILFPTIFDDWAGKATIGGQRFWINGYMVALTWLHEIGHNYGMQHSGTWKGENVATSTENQSDSSELHEEYGSNYDVMGSDYTYLGDFEAPGKNYLNWIINSQVKELNTASNETYRIYRFDQKNANNNPLLALKLDFLDSKTLWVSYRLHDSSNVWLKNGPSITWDYNKRKTKTRLLDMTPASRSDGDYEHLDAALPKGKTFIDPTKRINITTIATGGEKGNEWVDVQVSISERANTDPTVTLSAPSSGDAGKTITFRANATDQDNDQLNLFWDFGDGNTLRGGETVTHQFQTKGNFEVTVHSFDQNGGSGKASENIAINHKNLSWSSQQYPEKSNFTQVIYDHGKFAAISNQRLHTSFDGVEWETTSLSIFPSAIAAGNGGYMITGNNTSNKGSALFVDNSGSSVEVTPVPFKAIAYGDQTWVALGSDNSMYNKQLGGNWVKNGSLTASTGIAFGDGAFIAIGNGILRSTDKGKTWQPVTHPRALAQTRRLSDGNWDTTPGYRQIYYQDNRFITIGYREFHTSSNAGDTWETHLIPIDETDYRRMAISKDLNYFQDSKHDRHYFSSNGSIWGEHKADFSLGTYNWINPLIADGKIFLFGLQEMKVSTAILENTPPTVSLRYQYNQGTGKLETITIDSSDSDSDELYTYWLDENGQYKLGAESLDITQIPSEEQPTKILVSDGHGGLIEKEINLSPTTPNLPFQQWSQANTGNNEVIKDVSINNGRFIAAGAYKTHTSYDGVEWITVDSPIYSDNVAFSENGYMIVGHTSAPAPQNIIGAAAYSTDGYNWTRETIEDAPTFLKAVEYGNNMWVAVGTEGGILIKENTPGSKWTKPNYPALTSSLHIIAYGNGTFIIGGANNTLLKSTDNGKNWANISSKSPLPGTESINEMIFASGDFIMGGSAIYTSSDNGETWNTLPVPSGNVEYTAIASDGTHLFAASQSDPDGANKRTHANQLSKNRVSWATSNLTTGGYRHAAEYGSKRLVVVGDDGYISYSARNDDLANNPPKVELNTESSYTTNTPVTFTAKELDSRGYFYYWKINSELPVPGTNTFSTEFDSEGTHSVSLTIIDADGNALSIDKTLTATKANTPPTLTLTAPSEVELGTAATLTASASDVDGDALTYQWQIDDGALEAGTATKSITLTTEGSHTIKVIVSDGNGGSATEEKTILVLKPNTPPTLTLTAPSEVELGTAATLTASASDVDGDSLTYQWQIDDGALEAGTATKSITLTTAGSHTIKVIVSDGNGGSATEEKTILVLTPNTAPTLTLTAPSEVELGTAATVTASASDVDGDALTYQWQIGGGALEAGTATKSITLTTEGSHTIKVIVSDGNGGSASEETTIIVQKPNTPPTLELTAPSEVELGTAATVTASASDTDGDPLTYQWQIGGGALEAGTATKNITLTTSGSHTIKVIVSDGKGGSASKELNITVTKPNTPPTLEISAPAEVELDTAFTVTANASDADDDTLTYQWQVDGGAIENGTSTKSLIFSTVGSHTVKAFVADGNDGSASQEASIVVSAAQLPPSITISGPIEVTVTEENTFSISEFNSDEDALTYQWSIDDGTLETGNSEKNFTFETPGTVVIRAVVNYPGDQSADAEFSVTVLRKNLPTSEITNTFHQIEFYESKFYATGELGFYSSDNAQNWTKVSLPIFSAAFITETSGFTVVGRRDTTLPAIAAIAHSTDGINWTVQDTPDSAPALLAIDSNATSSIAVGQNGAILRKTNLSAWTSINSGTTENLTSIVFTANSIIVGGENGVLLKSVDEGLTWSSLSSNLGTNENIQAIEYAGGTLLVASDRLYQSTDDGQSWTEAQIVNEFGSFVDVSSNAGSTFAISKLWIAASETWEYYDHYSSDLTTWHTSRITSDTQEPLLVVADNKRIQYGNEDITHITPAVLSNFSLWMRSTNTHQLAETQSLYGDADNDDTLNIIEYAFGLKNSTEEHDAPFATQYNASSGRIQTTFNIRVNDNKLSSRIYTSSDLSTWTAINLNFDSNTQAWTSTTENIGPISASLVEEGVWQLSFEITSSFEKLFFKAAVDYDSI